MVTATWDDAPHLTEQAKKELYASIPEYERDARTRGIPFLGSGRVYPLTWDAVSCEDFPIPPYWKQGYGLDVGWNFTAAVWGAYNEETDTSYIWSEYKDGQQSPILHAAAIKARGTWLPGDIDPSANGERRMEDGKQLTKIYQENGLNLQLADNTVQAGIYEVLTRMQTGRLKIFKSLVELRDEFLMYHREKGKIVKRHDHLLDALRYAIKRQHERWIVKPAQVADDQPIGGNPWANYGQRGNNSWMGT